MFMFGKISLILLLIVGVCIAAGPYNETTDFWAKQMGRNLSYKSYAGIVNVIIQDMSRSTDITTLARAACFTRCSRHWV
jgi:hypothetical protein